MSREVLIVDTGFEIFLKHGNTHLNLLEKMYLDMDIEVIIYNTSLNISNEEFIEVLNIFQNIQTRFNLCDYTIENLYENLKSEIESFVTCHRNYKNYLHTTNSLKEKYIPTLDLDIKFELDVSKSTFPTPVNIDTTLKHFYTILPNESNDSNEFNKKTSVNPYCNYNYIIDDKSQHYIILYSKYYNTSILYKYENNDFKILSDEFNDIIYYDNIRIHDDDDDKIELFHKRVFESFKDFETLLKSIRYLNTNLDYKIKTLITKYLDDNYEISSDIKYKIKSNVLYDNISKMISNNISDPKLNTKMVSNYLIKYGLKRRRFSDGYYYYGISYKTNKSDDSLKQKDTDIILDMIIKERSSNYDEYQKFYQNKI